MPIPFNYNAAGLSYDEATGTFTPGKLFGRMVGSEDGDLGFPNDWIGGLPSGGKYAPIGPFGKWRLIVRITEDNRKLDLDKLTMIVIDFHGFHQSFLKPAA